MGEQMKTMLKRSVKTLLPTTLMLLTLLAPQAQAGLDDSRSAELERRRDGGPVRPDPRPRDPRGPGHPGPVTPPPRYPDNPPPRYPDNPRPRPGYPTPPPSHGQYESSTWLHNITRRIGGEWIRIELSYPVYMDSLQITTYHAGLQIHEATVYTDRGYSYNLNNLRYSGVLYNGQTVYSERLSHIDAVTSIDLRLESMGGVSDVLLRAITLGGSPFLRVIRY